MMFVVFREYSDIDYSCRVSLFITSNIELAKKFCIHAEHDQLFAKKKVGDLVKYDIELENKMLAEILTTDPSLVDSFDELCLWAYSWEELEVR